MSILSQLNELLNESFIISVCPSTKLNMAAGLDAYRLGGKALWKLMTYIN